MIEGECDSFIVCTRRPVRQTNFLLFKLLYNIAVYLYCYLVGSRCSQDNNIRYLIFFHFKTVARTVTRVAHWLAHNLGGPKLNLKFNDRVYYLIPYLPVHKLTFRNLKVSPKKFSSTYVCLLSHLLSHFQSTSLCPLFFIEHVQFLSHFDMFL